MAGKENREIKNSVFVDLFYEDESAEANEIALFNAIHDEPLPEGTDVYKRQLLRISRLPCVPGKREKALISCEALWRSVMG